MDEAIARRLVRHVGGQPGAVYGKGGKPSVLNKLGGYNNAGRHSPWAHSCNRGMRRWAEANGVLVPLDDHYEAITFREPSLPGHEFAPARDLSRRRMA